MLLDIGQIDGVTFRQSGSARRKERAANRACVNENAPDAGVEAPRAAVEIERQFNGAASRSYLHVSHASDAQANLNHTHGVTNNVHLA